MTVDREAFGKFGRDNNSTMVGRAMVNCYNSHPAGDDMYKEVRVTFILGKLLNCKNGLIENFELC